MDGRCAQALECGEMLFHGVAFVPGKAVTRVLRIEPLHQGIARRLGKDRCRGDRQAFAISFDDRLLGNVQVPDTPRVHKHMLGWARERFDGAPHRQQASPIDVEAVDLGDLRKPDGPGGGGTP